jgi:hypothetical protein
MNFIIDCLRLVIAVFTPPMKYREITGYEVIALIKKK